jgi:16S rRNA (cytosine967-C5)-methyltransferase
MAHRTVSLARRAAHEALLRLDSGVAHFEAVMREEPAIAALDARDGALAWELVAGVTRRRLTLDAVLASFSAHPLARIEPRARAALRLGAYQLLFLQRVPAHAAVDEAVALAAPLGRQTGGFVNAVLRRVADHGEARLAALGRDNSVAALSVRYSCPQWLVRRWLREWGLSRAQGLLAATDRVPERCLRVNTLLTTRAAASARLADDGIASDSPGTGVWSRIVPDALVIRGGRLERAAAYRDGMVTAQARASQLVGVMAATGAPEATRVADLCAAPGAKTSHLGALLPGCEIVAVEVDERRADDLRSLLTRLQVRRVEVLVADAAALPGKMDASFDLVLLDAPCSGLGTLAERPDLRWRRRSSDIAHMGRLQLNLAMRAARLLRPGGTLVYAVCTLTREETLDVVAPLATDGGLLLDDLGAAYPELRHPDLGAALLTLPDRDGTSGFFVARLRRPPDATGS